MQLCEIDLSNLLPPSAFFPFTDEIEKRKAERRRRRKQVALKYTWLNLHMRFTQ